MSENVPPPELRHMADDLLRTRFMRLIPLSAVIGMTVALVGFVTGIREPRSSRYAAAPPVSAAPLVGDRPAGVELPDDIPNYKSPSGKFMWRLLTAWIAMGFRAPPIEATKGYAR